MPIIRVDMLTGRSRAQKRALAKELTESFIATCGGNKQSVNVIITEVEEDNWAIGTTLIADRKGPS